MSVTTLRMSASLSMSDTHNTACQYVSGIRPMRTRVFTSRSTVCWMSVASSGL
jgi:hypothetical protein